MENFSTIVAISTPLGVGGISIIRMSGKDSIDIASKVFKSKNDLKPRVMTLGDFVAKDFKEKCLCVYFKSPYSFTGEDMIEFQCHGGVALTNGILSALLDNGASLASPGEFTKRAFINGKMNLSQAEGMMDMINAESDAEIRAGYKLLNGELAKNVKKYQEMLTDLISEIEVSFDYPENDYELDVQEKIDKVLKEIKQGVEKLIATSDSGKIIKDGVNVLIIGRPNVGKSSLLNALINEDKAIVTSTAGTTRDIIESKYLYNGIKFNIYDTAGLRKTDDEIENIGIEKAKSLINSADIILRVVDSTVINKKDDEFINNLLTDKKVYLIKNKIDISPIKEGADFYISAKTKDGINELKQGIYDIVFKDKLKENSLVITNKRHLEILKKVKKYIENALENVKNVTLDVVSIDINLAWQALGEITGDTSNETILDEIFSKFCLGK